jgi:hypothetical protein
MNASRMKPGEAKRLSSGCKQFTVLSVATQRSWKNADDEWSSKTEWHRIVLIWNLTVRQTPRGFYSRLLKHEETDGWQFFPRPLSRFNYSRNPQDQCPTASGRTRATSSCRN